MIVARGMYHGRRHVLESVKSHDLYHVETVTPLRVLQYQKLTIPKELRAAQGSL